MDPLTILTLALAAAQKAFDLYLGLKTIWQAEMTPEQKEELEARENDLFAKAHWKPSK